MTDLDTPFREFFVVEYQTSDPDFPGWVPIGAGTLETEKDAMMAIADLLDLMSDVTDFCITRVNTETPSRDVTEDVMRLVVERLITPETEDWPIVLDKFGASELRAEYAADFAEEAAHRRIERSNIRGGIA